MCLLAETVLSLELGLPGQQSVQAGGQEARTLPAGRQVSSGRSRAHLRRVGLAIRETAPSTRSHTAFMDSSLRNRKPKSFFFFFLGAGQRVRLCTGLQEPAGTPAQLQTEKQRGVMGPGPGENQHCLAWRPPPGRPVPFPHTTQGQCLQTALEKCSHWESGGLFHWRRRLITI